MSRGVRRRVSLRVDVRDAAGFAKNRRAFKGGSGAGRENLLGMMAKLARLDYASKRLTTSYEVILETTFSDFSIVFYEIVVHFLNLPLCLSIRFEKNSTIFVLLPSFLACSRLRRERSQLISRGAQYRKESVGAPAARSCALFPWPPAGDSRNVGRRKIEHNREDGGGFSKILLAVFTLEVSDPACQSP